MKLRRWHPQARRIVLSPELWDALVSSRILVHADGRVELVHVFSPDVGYAVEVGPRFARRLRPMLEAASRAVAEVQAHEDAQRREFARMGL